MVQLDSLRRSTFGALYGVLMIGGIGNTVVLSALPALGRSVGLPDLLVTAVFALSALSWAITAPLWGRLSDRTGRRPLLLLGLGGGATSMIAFGAVSAYGLQRVWPMAAVFVGLMLSRGMNGLVASAASSSAQAYVADRTSRQDRTRAMAALASAVGLGTVVGPSLVPALGLVGIDIPGAMVLVGLGNLAMMGLVICLVPSEGRPPLKVAAKTSGFLDPRIRPFIVFGFTMISIQAVNTAVLGFVVIDRVGDVARGQVVLSSALVCGAVATLFAQWVLIPALKLRAGQLLRAAPVLIALGSLCLWLTHGGLGAVLGYSVMCLGLGLGRPGYTSGASLAVGPEGQGMVAGVTNALSGACFVVTPILSVLAYGVFRPLPFILDTMAAVALGLFVVLTPALMNAGAPPKPLAQ